MTKILHTPIVILNPSTNKNKMAEEICPFVSTRIQSLKYERSNLDCKDPFCNDLITWERI